MDYNYDPEYLISPDSGPAKSERAVMEHFFPVNYQQYQPQRMSRVGKFGRVIIKAPGESGTLLTTRAWDQVMEVDRLIREIVVKHEG